MKNRLSVIITLTIFLSGSGMAALDSILEALVKLETSDMNSNLGDISSMCSHLDALIANNKAMSEAWLPQPCCEQEDQLKKAVEVIKEQDLIDYLSQFDDCGEVAEKLLILKDHEYYHYILLQIVMGLRRYYSTNEYDLARSFINKGAPRLQVCGSIIKETIKQLTSEDRSFEKRPHFVRKLSDASSMKAGAEEEELEGEPLKAKHSNVRYHDKDSGNSVCTSVLLYKSKGRECNLNCEVYRNGELVRCCHLAAWWLQLKEFEYGGIDSEENIGRCKKIPCNEELDKSFTHNGCPSEGIYFEINQFPKVIYDVAISLSEGQGKRYFVNSINHAMGLYIKRNKYNNIIIYYYDPNDTLRHKEIIASTADDLKYLHYDDFWNLLCVHTYFPGQDKVCCLLSLHTKALQKDCKVLCMHKPSANLMHLLGRHGHCGHPAVFFDLKGLDRRTKKELITGDTGIGMPALYIACQNRHLEAVSALMTMITNVDLDPDVKKELLAGRRKDGTSSLFIACENGDLEIVTTLIAGILRDDLNLSNGEKAELLAGKNENGCLALYIACQNGHHKTVTALFAAICRGDLNLNNSKRIELLAGKNENGFPALYIACQHGHDKTVTAIIAWILRADLNFNNDGKTEFSAGENTHCFSALIFSCISAIRRCSRNFSKNPKAELLAGKNKEGCPALHIACENGYLDVVTAFVSGICSSGLSLSQSEKAKLLAGKDAYGVSALERASALGHDKIVEVLRNCGM